MAHTKADQKTIPTSDDHAFPLHFCVLRGVRPGAVADGCTPTPALESLAPGSGPPQDAFLMFMPAVVWILEDDENLGLFYQAFISLTHPGTELRLFTTGEAALTAIGVPDIVLSDTHLAGRLTGPEAVQVLRKRNSQLAVIFCSGLGPPPLNFFGPRDVCLGKPFSVAELLKQFNLMLSRIPRLHTPPHHPHSPSQARTPGHRRHHHK